MNNHPFRDRGQGPLILGGIVWIPKTEYGPKICTVDKGTIFTAWPEMLECVICCSLQSH